MKIRMQLWAALLAMFVMTIGASAGDWANWRGPNYNGSSPEKNLPTIFSKTKNVKWAVPMPGPSAATPIVVGDHVYVSTTNPEERTLHAMCFESLSEHWSVNLHA